jgi:hypothetical protein
VRADDELHALLHTVMARVMKVRAHRGVLVKDIGQTWLVEPPGDGKQARQPLCADIDGINLDSAVGFAERAVSAAMASLEPLPWPVP